MISLNQVSMFYPPKQAALSDINMKIFPGEFVFIAGASGAGKSTLLKLLSGAERASSGQVVVGGRNLAAVSDDRHRSLFRREIGVVFQDYKLLPRRSVLENVTYGLEVRGVRSDARRSLGLRILKAIGLEDKSSAQPMTLSGGEQQRVALARALISKPRLVLADEPTGNLDHEMSQVVFNLLLEANRNGVTVVVATHDLATIERLNKRTLVLDRGRLIGDFEQTKGRKE